MTTLPLSGSSVPVISAPNNLLPVCGVCSFKFNTDDRVPLFLTCRHFFCRACLSSLIVVPPRGTRPVFESSRRRYKRGRMQREGHRTITCPVAACGKVTTLSTKTVVCQPRHEKLIRRLQADAVSMSSRPWVEQDDADDDDGAIDPTGSDAAGDQEQVEEAGNDYSEKPELEAHFEKDDGPTDEAGPPPKKPKTQTSQQPDGLQITDIQLGSGEKVETGSQVWVKYTGKLPSGEVFGCSRGKPFGFTVGKGHVIKGWDIGVLGMAVGGKRNLVVPAALGCTLYLSCPFCCCCSHILAFTHSHIHTHTHSLSLSLSLSLLL
jgi:FKBP-type peptidyl-prolyl cis-trans isomerase